MSEPVIPCPTCPEGWRPLDKEHCADCYEGQIDDLTKANQILQALIGNRDKEVDRLREALRYIINEGDHVSRWVLGDKAREALAALPPVHQTPIENKGGSQS